jgi:hypothetical protein
MAIITHLSPAWVCIGVIVVNHKPLFGKSLHGNFYNYCPSMRLENDTLHVWYCTNKDSGNITDYIGYRTGHFVDGFWRFSNEKIVLGPTKGTWDARHTCDPSVIKGAFQFNGEEYHYLMVYLGCITDDCKDNETGIAFSNNIAGPWIKLPNNPLIPFINSKDFKGPHIHWGYGQPSVVSVDKAGQCIIFYNVGIEETFTRAEHWDLSNLNHPVKIQEVRIIDDGYINIEGKPDVIGNADFAFDPITHCFYAVGDMRVRGNDEPTYISNALPVLMTNLCEDEKHPMESLFTEQYKWKKLEVIDEHVSSFAKNHNPGIMTDIYGWVYHPSLLLVGYTRSDLNKAHPKRVGIWPSLHTYRIYGHEVKLD